MRLFKRKLTTDQQKEILKFANNFYSICSPCREAYDELHSCTAELYYICKEALQQDIEPEGVDTLIENAQEACEKYAMFLANTYDRYLNVSSPAKWYPKKLRKAYDSWGVCLHGQIAYLNAAKNALQPPKPLAHEPRISNDKLKERLTIAILGFSSPQGKILYLLSLSSGAQKPYIGSSYLHLPPFFLFWAWFSPI
jgi:hypothetical protein